MKHKHLHKGITIVELIVVIAVVAILTAILFPLFLGNGEGGGTTTVETFVRNINERLAKDEVAKGEKNGTMYDAVLVGRSMGFDIETITPFNGKDIIWDQDNDRFALVNASSETTKSKADVLYAEASFNVANPTHRFWKVYDTYAPSATQGYSIYARAKNWNVSEVKNLRVGFDAGDATTSLIEYARIGASQTVTIRSNGGDIEVNAPEDTVHHYGKAHLVNITAVSHHSYDEYGEANLIDIKTGRLVITKKGRANIKAIYLSATDDEYNNIILATQGETTLPEIVMREQVNLPTGENNKLVVTIQNNVDEKGQHPQSVEKIYLYPAKDVKESELGYDVSDLGKLVVEAISNEAQAQAEEQIQDPTELEKAKATKTATVEEAQTIVDVREAAVAYVTHGSGVIGIEYGILFNQYNGIERTRVQEGYDFRAFSDEETVYADAFVSAKENGQYIFSDHIEDYSNEAKIAKALAVLKKERGEEFAAKAEAILNARKEYFNWRADFEVTFSDDIVPGSVALAGYYDAFAENFYNGEWLGFGVSDFDAEGNATTLKAGKALRLLDTGYVYGEKAFGKKIEDLHMSYAAICGYVKEFRCGITNLSAENTGKTVTVKLYVYETDDKGNETGLKVECASMSYRLEAPQANA